MDSISVTAETSANEMRVQQAGHLPFFYSRERGHVKQCECVESLKKAGEKGVIFAFPGKCISTTTTRELQKQNSSLRKSIS